MQLEMAAKQLYSFYKNILQPLSPIHIDSNLLAIFGVHRRRGVAMVSLLSLGMEGVLHFRFRWVGWKWKTKWTRFRTSGLSTANIAALAR